MLEEETARLLRLLEAEPGEDDGWIRLAEQLARTGEDWPAAPGGARALGAALGRHPAQRGLARWWLHVHGLRPDPGPVPVAWSRSGRLVADEERGFDGITGLPLRVHREADGAGMRLVPAGRSPDGEAVGAFYLDELPVAVDGYRAFLAATGTRPPDAWRELKRYTGRPMVLVTLSDARAYAAWAGGRLPSGPEWGRAAYGDDGRSFPWGEEVPDETRAWFRRGWGTPSDWLEGLPVLGARPDGEGPWGHRDLAGTVWEWCEDPEQEEEGSDPETRRLALGGSYSSETRDLKRGVSTWLIPESRHPDVGFRLAMPV